MAKNKNGGKPREYRPATDVVLAGRAPFEFEGFVNTPIFRGSTVLSPTAEQFLNHSGRYTYGRRGTPTTKALEASIAAHGLLQNLSVVRADYALSLRDALGPV